MPPSKPTADATAPFPKLFVCTYPPLPPRRSATGLNAWRHDQLTLGELHEQGQGAAQRPVRYVSPPFQRALCWSPARRCDYLQSMLMGEPQPPLALWQPQGAQHTLVLDGQHRLASLGCEVYGVDGQRRVLDDVRLNLHTLEWEPGTADGLSTLSPERLLKPHHHLWLNKQANDEGWWDHVLNIIKRLHSHNQTPVLMSTAPETPAAWREAVSFFVRMAQSVPFTEAELEAMTAYAAGMGKGGGAASGPDGGAAPAR